MHTAQHDDKMKELMENLRQIELERHNGEKDCSIEELNEAMKSAINTAKDNFTSKA